MRYERQMEQFDILLLFFLAITFYPLMLEKNTLFRRMQHHNIFRTFSRTYSRQVRAASPNTQDVTLPVDANNHSYNFKGPTRTYTSQQSSRRDTYHPQTTQIHLKTSQDSQRQVLLSQTVNINLLTSKFSNDSSKDRSPYLSNLMAKRKGSDSLLFCIKGRKQRQNFKLKSCAPQDHEHYEAKYDESQYSILELQRQSSKNNWVHQDGAWSMGGFKRVNREPRRVRPQVGKKVAAHVFSKYSQLIIPSKVKAISACGFEG